MNKKNLLLAILFLLTRQSAYSIDLAQDSIQNKNFVPVMNLDSLMADTLVESTKQSGPHLENANKNEKNDSSKIVDMKKVDSLPQISGNKQFEKSEADVHGAIVHGVVVSADDDKPIAEATIILKRDTIQMSAQTDASGLYRIVKIEPGMWKFSVSRKGYETKTGDLEALTSGEDRVFEIRLDRRLLKGQVIQASVERKTGSTQDLLSKRQKATAVLEGVSAEQIAKTTDADAGAIARRVTGASLIGDKYIYVRGLGERYTNMTLNGLPVPSPEKDKRVVPQDLFPASTIESFSIYKTFIPELYSDFAGGSVAVVTKGIPDKPFFKISIASGNQYRAYKDTSDYLLAYREESQKNNRSPKTLAAGWQVGNERLAYNGGNTFWGFDDGTRSLPDGFPSIIPRGYTEAQAQAARAKGQPGYSLDERINFANELSNTYALDTSKIRIPSNLSISGGNIYSAPNEGKFGFLAMASFKNKYASKVIEKQQIGAAGVFYSDTIFHPILQRIVVNPVPLYDTVKTDSGSIRIPVVNLQPGTTALIDQGSYEAQLSGMLNMRYENPDWAIWWKNFAINIGTDRALLTNSYQSPRGGGTIAQGSPYEERYLLDFNRRSLVCSQIGGEAYIGKGILDSMTWAAGLSTVTGETPDSRRYLYSQSTVTPTNPLNFANVDVWGTRIFEKLDEKAVAARIDGFFLIPKEISVRDTFFMENRIFSHLALPIFSAGLAWNGRSRNFNTTRYTYDFDDRNITGKKIEQIRAPDSLIRDSKARVADFTTSPKDFDTYKASELKASTYITTSISARLWNLPLGLDGGARGEWYNFNLVAPYTGTLEGNFNIEKETKEWDVFPTVGLWLQPAQPLKIRWQFAQTEVHPEIREVSPNSFADYITGTTILGNPDLDKTRINNYDIRADIYLPYQQSISASLFYKSFTKPVEKTINIDKVESFQNSRSAYVKGVEFEAILNPGRLLEGLNFSAPWLKGLQISGNFALMESEVRISTDTNQNLQNTNFTRPMVGQAPYLINGSVSHEIDAGSFSFLNVLLFNQAGERIRYAGTVKVPDILEVPFASLESLHRFTWWKRNEISIRVKNWLMQSKELRVKETNDQLTYHTVTESQYQEVFKNIERYQTVEHEQGFISVEISYSRQY